MQRFWGILRNFGCFSEILAFEATLKFEYKKIQVCLFVYHGQCKNVELKNVALLNCGENWPERPLDTNIYILVLTTMNNICLLTAALVFMLGYINNKLNR